jgi:hypothetical protein
MRVLTKTQRTPEWFAAKRGVISASAAQLALAGRHTKGRRLYVQKLADDLEGIPDFAEEDNPPWFTDGRFYESWARGWYSFKFDVDVEETGFIAHDRYSFIGCSPDGFVGTDGMCEIKYRKTIKTFKQHAAAEMTKPVIAQLQTQMFVCDRQWNDYVNYWRAVEHEREMGHVQRVYRDESYINNTLLPAFVRLWNDVQHEMRMRDLMRKKHQG